ncbi:hypothetical protein QR680_013449 [Steinernema hermaphroditum]|uniref:Uncharacterized protein n=1 Tax=Steinernema hermaphroditum TaxID=289476 RepID=A0AA39I5J7_9BILA|nr:hypothetical protein QR680_013449 [Steinernema hermaphroditum]
MISKLFLALFLIASAVGQIVYETPVAMPFVGYNAYVPGYYNYLSYPLYGGSYAYTVGSNKGVPRGPSRPMATPKLFNEK